jgi:hypothetical protein
VRVDVEQQSALEALWALGALEPKKGLKRPDARVWGVVEREPKTAPKRRRFLPLFTGTETYAVEISSITRRTFVRDHPSPNCYP